MDVQMTEEQRLAVSARGNVITSASAGSGKTFVMIGRIAARIEEGGDVRRMIAVTFTKKAAAQMREKLRGALIRRIVGSGGEQRARLKEQLSALPLAEISTIHSFCARLIRANFFLADTDPAFRVISAEDAEGSALSEKALNEVFEEAYEENGEDFLKLLAVYFRGKKDSQLRAAVRDMYRAARGRADYRAELTRTDGSFEAVCRYLAEDYRTRVQFCMEAAEDYGAFFAEYSEKAFQVCADIMAAAERLYGAQSLFEMRAAALEPPQISRMPVTTKATGEAREKLNALKELSAFVKSLYKEIAALSPEEEEKRRFEDGKERAAALSRLALRYDAVYSRLKKEAGVLDYEDLEYCALQILSDETFRLGFAQKYDYVFVDEYQDVNEVQEKIISLLPGEVFLVGDAKQSIYAFRGSRSDYFIQKTKEFPVSLTLSENFRSAPAVIEAVNRVFSRCMTERTCGLDYAGSSYLRGGSRYGEHAGKVSFHVIPALPEEERSERGVYSVLRDPPKKRDGQAEEIVRLIEREIGSEWYDPDAGMMKRVEYGDIAVLVRKTKTQDAANTVRALSESNIPVTTTAKVNVCDFWEARLLIDWLSYLDNAEQDIPMAGAMLSRIGGFCDEELAVIRLRFPSPYTFRAACAQYREKMNDRISGKLRAFSETTQRYRALSEGKRAEEMIGLLLSEGLEEEIAAKKDGRARLSRVRRLAAESGDLSVNAFLRRLKASSYRVDYSESGGENAVKVLTMHAAKGLEYPVVILASLDAPFHGAENGDVLYSGQFGFAPRSFNLEKRTYGSTLRREAICAEERREEVKGELNLFYVAMTRAKYKLHMLFHETKTALSPAFAKRFSDFIDFSDCSAYFTEIETPLPPPFERKAFVYRPDEETVNRILSVYRRPYPFEESVSLPVKSSATGFMEAGRGENAAETYLAAEGGTDVLASDVETGLAYHAFLEFARFGADAREELLRMKQEGLLTEKQAALLSEKQLAGILELPSLKAAAGKRVMREQKFLVSVPAREIPALHTRAEDEIMVQGAIDLLVEDHGGYTILDYKFSSHSDERLRADYALQLFLYQKAVAKITGMKEERIRARILNIMRLREIEM